MKVLARHPELPRILRILSIGFPTPSNRGNGDPYRTDASTYCGFSRALGVTRGDGQAVRGEGRRNLTPGGPATDPDQVTLLVDVRHVREAAEVDHDAAVIGAEP